jgi:hypothetical protein
VYEGFNTGVLEIFGAGATVGTRKVRLYDVVEVQGRLVSNSGDGPKWLVATNDGTNGSRIDHSSGWSVDVKAGDGNSANGPGQIQLQTSNGTLSSRNYITNLLVNSEGITVGGRVIANGMTLNGRIIPGNENFGIESTPAGKVRIGTRALFAPTSVSDFPLGPFFKCSEFTQVTSGTYSLPYSTLLGGDNFAGVLYFFARRNDSFASSLVQEWYLRKSVGTNLEITLTHEWRRGITTFSVSTSSSNINISCDNNIWICWKFEGAY